MPVPCSDELLCDRLRAGCCDRWCCRRSHFHRHHRRFRQHSNPLGRGCLRDSNRCSGRCWCSHCNWRCFVCAHPCVCCCCCSSRPDRPAFSCLLSRSDSRGCRRHDLCPPRLPLRARVAVCCSSAAHSALLLALHIVFAAVCWRCCSRPSPLSLWRVPVRLHRRQRAFFCRARCDSRLVQRPPRIALSVGACNLYFH